MDPMTTLGGAAAVSPALAPNAPNAPGRREVSTGDAQGFSSMMADMAQMEKNVAASPFRVAAPAGSVDQPVNALYTGGDMRSSGLGDKILVGLQKIDESVNGRIQEVHQRLEKFESQKTELSMLDGMKLMVNMTSMMTEVEFFSGGVKKLDTAVDSLLHTS
ncbi:hypothetical protein [Noviherbaspirillum sp.]|uniref:hypothetical protein n=1 Tax=Noviherbaspirillum sp. TaxID=1926288 RepID=UPI002B49DF6E|nr:hypothetical protein [Noviherbaspirillum sp.]HJV80593.1 hypothetical protein [Noviherbaspirillum sp.]